jgi:2-keto-3-deoxy-6-phosphogluconate aldolase
MAISTPTTAGQILTSAYVNNNINSGTVYVKSQTIGSGVGSVTVTDAFSATYDNYNIVITGGVASTNANLAMTLGASVTGYFAAYSYVNIGTGGTAVVTNNNATSWTAVGLATATQVSMNLWLQNPFAAANTMLQGGYGRAVADNVASYNGGHGVATSYTSFTITPSAGTLTGGIITVYGYRKA